MKNILFVDDEINALQGLQRVLHSMRMDWKTEFVTSGGQALEKLERSPFDVIVTDFQMPDMNGAQLLNEVMRRFPKTVRIVLTGSSDREMTLKCVGSTHQCLSKPCDPEELRAVIHRATSISASLENEGLRSLVSQMDRLPTIPALYIQILQALQDPQTTVEDVGRIIAGDIGMTAQILKLVNSAFFGLGQTVSTPTEAAMYLGLDTIRALVLSANIFSQYESLETFGFSMDELMNHSIQTADAARLIAREEGAQKLSEESFVAGMLHDAGKLILAANFPDQYLAAMQAASRRKIPVIEAEKEYFRANHAEVGGYLLGLWGLPAPIVEAISLHHTPLLAENKTFNSLTAVHVADVLVEGRCPHDPGIPMSEVDGCYLAELGLLDHLGSWRSAWENNSHHA